MLNFLKLNPDYSKRVFGLDIMRAIAILQVVFSHGSPFLEVAGTRFPWIPLPDGVELFFVLSGFLIGSILLKIIDHAPRFTVRTILNFLKRRWFRTLPNYYFILLLNVLLVYTGIIKGDIHQFNWKFFLFLQNFSSGFYDFFWESWSLSVEEWFYILFPFTLLLLLLISKTNHRKNIFLTGIIIFMIVPVLLRINVLLETKKDTFWLGVDVWKVVIYRLDSISFGIMAAYLNYFHKNIFYRFKNLLFIVGFTLIYSVQLSHSDLFFLNVFHTTLISIGAALLLPRFNSIKKGTSGITKVITHISLTSYSMYLLNLGLVASVITQNFFPQTKFTAYTLYAFYWMAVIVLSTCLYKYFEKPFMDLRDRKKISHSEKTG